MPWPSWRFASNVLGSQGATTPFHLETTTAGMPTGDVALDQAQSQAPAVFQNNRSEAPAFRDAARLSSAAADPSQRALSMLDDLFAAAEITTTAIAEPVATLTADASGTTLTVDDATAIYDGFGIEAGDVLVIGAQSVTAVQVVDAHTLFVDQPVTAASGTPITLARYSTTPAPGVHRSF
jgi:hypothetical protein